VLAAAAGLEAQLALQASVSPPSNASALFRVSASQLRPLGSTADPLTLLLTQLHKLLYVTQLPPSRTRDWKRTLVTRYKHALFARHDLPHAVDALKRELQQLAAAGTDFIDAAYELPHLDAASVLISPQPQRHATPTSAAAAAGGHQRITHEEMHSCIEQLLEESGYYSQQQQPLNAAQQLHHLLPSPSTNGL
jgi:NIMA (never in mitosis gene a)-related kinase